MSGGVYSCFNNYWFSCMVYWLKVSLINIAPINKININKAFDENCAGSHGKLTLVYMQIPKMSRRKLLWLQYLVLSNYAAQEHLK